VGSNNEFCFFVALISLSARSSLADINSNGIQPYDVRLVYLYMVLEIRHMMVGLQYSEGLCESCYAKVMMR
jgi:hypothetical protein